MRALLAIVLLLAGCHVQAQSTVVAVNQVQNLWGTVAAVAIANVDPADAPATIDGVTLATGDRVLLTGQTDPVENGVYLYTDASPNTLARPYHSNNLRTGAFATLGAAVTVEGGTAYAGTEWYLAETDGTLDGRANSVAQIDTDEMVFRRRGDVTSPVANSQLATVATATIKGRITTGTGTVEDLTASQVRTLLNVADGANAYVLPVATTTTIGGVKRNEGAAGQYITGFDASGNAMYDEPASLAYRPGMNMLLNGDFSVNQRGTAFTSTSGANNDGAYTSDRWFILSDGNDIVDVESSNYRLKLDTETANKKFGIAQIIESSNAEKALGRAVTLSFTANWANGQVEHVKAAILEWTGTTDAPTRDFVSAWNGDNTNPTLVANWAYLNTPADLNVTNSGTVYSVTATVGTSAKNLAVLIWSDSTASTVGNLLYIYDAQLEEGASFTEFQRLDFADQLARCQRYYENLHFGDYGSVALSNQRSASSFHAAWYFHARKFRKPTVSVISGTWAGGTPTIQASVDHVDFSRAGSFNLNGASGDVALAASAEF